MAVWSYWAAETNKSRQRERQDYSNECSQNSRNGLRWDWSTLPNCFLLSLDPLWFRLSMHFRCRFKITAFTDSTLQDYPHATCRTVTNHLLLNSTGTIAAGPAWNVADPRIFSGSFQNDRGGSITFQRLSSRATLRETNGKHSLAHKSLAH